MATVETRPAPIDLGAYGPQGRSAWQDIDWREHQHWLEIDGRKVNYVELGEGDPLLLVHGHSGSWQNWLENIPHFARSHRVIAMDLPGFGYSEMPRERISMESYGVFLDRFCDAVGVSAAAVVGNSMGGFAGAEMAIKFPPRVERLVLVSAAGLSTRYIGLSAELMRRKSVVALARAVNAFAGVPEARAQFLVRRPRLRRLALEMVALHPHRLSPAISRELIRGSGRPAAPFAMQAIATYDYGHRLRDITCPTLIVWGRQDRVVPVESAGLYEELIPNSRKVIFENTGHIAMVERPEAFHSLVDELLDEAVSPVD